MTALLAAGCSDPDDPNHGSSPGFSSAPEQCAPGNAFEPLRAPRAVLEEGISGLCLLCSVFDAEAVVDADPASFATLNVPLSVAGTAYVSVFDTARTHPPGTRVAIFVAGEEDLIPVTIALNQQIRMTTFLNGAEQESTSPDEGQVPIVLSLLDLPSLLFTPTNPGPRAVGGQVSKEFDQVRLDFGGGLQVLNALRLFEVCVNDGG
ncbi:hypothetical protein [Sinimarinibacterium flocculans]|uniref:hypothetical protein n=1 Tax=Sinimarinibacterium flocculans TaxID=985250 RepID=UPI003515F9D8